VSGNFALARIGKGTMDREGKASDLVHHLILLHVADVNGGLVGC